MTRLGELYFSSLVLRFSGDKYVFQLIIWQIPRPPSCKIFYYHHFSRWWCPVIDDVPVNWNEIIIQHQIVSGHSRLHSGGDLVDEETVRVRPHHVPPLPPHLLPLESRLRHFNLLHRIRDIDFAIFVLFGLWSYRFHLFLFPPVTISVCAMMFMQYTGVKYFQGESKDLLESVNVEFRKSLGLKL